MNQTLTADQLIGYHRNKADYKQSPHNSLQLAYGDHRYVKFTYELLNESDILKLKILRELYDDFKLSNNISLALLSSDLLSVLLKHLENNNHEIRELASRNVVQVCSTQMGRDKIIQAKYIEHISKLINDKVDQIRTNSYNALLNFVEFLEGKDHVLEYMILENLVNKLLEEKNTSILNKALELMHLLLKGEKGTTKVLATECIKRLLNLISHQNAKIRQNVCANLAAISFNETGKANIVSKKAVQPLCSRLSDQVSVVRQMASLCLCSLAQLNQAKNQIIQLGFLDRIFSLLHDPNKFIKLNIVQLIGSLAQHPEGRKHAMACIPLLEKLTDVEKTYIEGTIEVIKWKP